MNTKHDIYGVKNELLPTEYPPMKATRYYIREFIIYILVTLISFTTLYIFTELLISFGLVWAFIGVGIFATFLLVLAGIVTVFALQLALTRFRAHHYRWKKVSGEWLAYQSETLQRGWMIYGRQGRYSDTTLPRFTRDRGWSLRYNYSRYLRNEIWLDFEVDATEWLASQSETLKNCLDELKQTWEIPKVYERGYDKRAEEAWKIWNKASEEWLANQSDELQSLLETKRRDEIVLQKWEKINNLLLGGMVTTLLLSWWWSLNWFMYRLLRVFHITSAWEVIKRAFNKP